MRLTLALMLSAPFALAACTDPFASLRTAPDPAAEAAPAQPAPVGPPAVSPLEQPIEVAVGEQLATVDGVTNRSHGFKAQGAGWTAHAAGNSTVFTNGGSKPRSVRVRKLAFAGGVEYIGVVSDRPYALRVTNVACSDGAGSHAFTARMTVQGRSLNGCADATTENPPKAPAAPGVTAKPAAPAKPKPATPAPATPAPATPAPATPAPATPAPATPAPATPAPETPAPTTPAPATPAPTTPAPATPAPATPAPTGPVVIPPPPFVLPPLGNPPSMN
ncbi:hypothetical protein ACEYYB_03115 [Paracoccus sp. p4-l81]|uniref:hypothetical protein n=1 Tax=Paracoccus sp. p4-l81 TaxID=3342806 RepID=UPI0035B77E58